ERSKISNSESVASEGCGADRRADQLLQLRVPAGCGPKSHHRKHGGGGGAMEPATPAAARRDQGKGRADGSETEQSRLPDRRFRFHEHSGKAAAAEERSPHARR